MAFGLCLNGEQKNFTGLSRSYSSPLHCVAYSGTLLMAGHPLNFTGEGKVKE